MNELERIFVEKFDCDCEEFREWIEDNTAFSYCEDLSGDCFVYYNGKFYIVAFTEFVEIREIDKKSWIEHVKTHNNWEDVAKMINN